MYETQFHRQFIAGFGQLHFIKSDQKFQGLYRPACISPARDLWKEKGLCFWFDSRFICNPFFNRFRLTPSNVKYGRNGLTKQTQWPVLRRSSSEIQGRHLCSIVNENPLLGRGEAHTGFWWGNPRERDHLEDLDVVESIILKLIFKKLVLEYGLDWSVSG